MDSLSTKEILLALAGSGGLIGGLVTVFTQISSRVDAYRARKRSDSGEAVAERNRLVDDLWKMIEAERKENEVLRAEIVEWEKADKLSRPTVTAIYRVIHRMRIRLDKLLPWLSQQPEEAPIHDCWEAVREHLDELENALSRDGETNVQKVV